MTIDFDAIKARLAAVQAAGISVIHTRLVDHGIRVWVSMRDWNGNNRYDADVAVTNMVGNACADIGALVAEVERLRELLLNAGWPREADGIAELALQAERAAVVAWLREWQNTMDDRITHDDLDYAIAVIERGEYRREEGPHYGLKIRS